jgi:16S rRNA U1498 N3-methylase RsmE
VILFCGDGIDREYRIEEITKKGITLKKEKEYSLQSEAERTVILYQSLPNKYEKIEWIIEK